MSPLRLGVDGRSSASRGGLLPRTSVGLTAARAVKGGRRSDSTLDPHPVEDSPNQEPGRQHWPDDLRNVEQYVNEAIGPGGIGNSRSAKRRGNSIRFH